MMRMMKIVFSVLILLVMVPQFHTEAQAQAGLAEAKARGALGERPDGLVGIVEASASADITALAQRVNAQRMEEYRKIAEETSAPLQAVQARAGRQIIQALPSGQYFMDAAGRWRQK
ncbi:hypothetical protein JCM17846_27910 [Iodidimonas nitroreducens]|uniref:DUF1318 domain-containing protein n=1 Tax=Iodidimonas nitroreducens TaxID=1236968 RepID=A0A5A7NDE9_9PROT|nr:YdbL family protein [Iodidimonas nitroreducens]GAK34427.1 hypothetical protein AQ1_02326 [alpha proteobacterium Q-1]GER05109.1 hypothetical protein JCM17846_27910 [Iodidimonas nitroreducens]